MVKALTTNTKKKKAIFMVSIGMFKKPVKKVVEVDDDDVPLINKPET